MKHFEGEHVLVKAKIVKVDPNDEAYRVRYETIFEPIETEWVPGDIILPDPTWSPMRQVDDEIAETKARLRALKNRRKALDRLCNPK